MAALDKLAKPGVYEKLDAYAARFCGRAGEVLAANGVPAMVARAGSLWQILFAEKAPENHAELAAGDVGRMRNLDLELLKRGQYVLPGIRRLVSLAHGEAETEWFAEAPDAACRAMKD